jgi:predicted nucleotidyltransferase
MAVPVTSIRAERHHRPLLQAVAEILRTEGTADLERFLTSRIELPIGPFRSADAALGFLRDRLVADLRPDAIWLFGSRARGDHRANSDFDLLVALPDGREDEAYSYEAVARPLVASGLPYDVVPARWSEILSGARQSGGLVARVINEGRLIYKRRKLDLPAGVA